MITEEQEKNQNQWKEINNQLPVGRIVARGSELLQDKTERKEKRAGNCEEKED